MSTKITDNGFWGSVRRSDTETLLVLIINPQDCGAILMQYYKTSHNNWIQVDIMKPIFAFQTNGVVGIKGVLGIFNFF